MAPSGSQSLYVFGMQALGLLFFVFAGIALKTGVVRTRGQKVYRADNPAQFTLLICFLVGLGLFTLFLAGVLASPHTVIVPTR